MSCPHAAVRLARESRLRAAYRARGHARGLCTAAVPVRLAVLPGGLRVQSLRPARPQPAPGGQHRGEPVFTLPGEHEPWLSEARGELELVHRGLVILRPRQPYVLWAKRIAPAQGDYTQAQARRSDTMALLMPSDDLGIESAEAFVDEHWPHFFAQAPESWRASTRPLGRQSAVRLSCASAPRLVLC